MWKLANEFSRMYEQVTEIRRLSFLLPDKDGLDAFQSTWNWNRNMKKISDILLIIELLNQDEWDSAHAPMTSVCFVKNQKQME